MSRPDFVEQIPLVLPALEQTYSFGALWDCKTSTFLRENLFGSSPHEQDPELLKHLVFFPKKELVYNLSHVKDTKSKSLNAKIELSAVMEINVFVGKIRINIGSGMYDNTVTTNTNVENLQVKYEQETFVVRALPSANKIVDEDILARLVQGSLDCTHVLTEVFYGAEVLSTIRFKKVHTDMFEDKSSSGLGKLIMGPLSAAVKAGLSALSSLNGGNEESFELELESNFDPALPEPKTIDEMFNIVDNLAEKLEAGRQPYPDHDELKEIKGWPIRYFLVPIQHFLDLDTPIVDPKFRILQGHFMDDFTAMLGRLRDFGEDEYLRHYICQRDFRLKQMLSDENNKLCVDVIEAGVEYKRIATGLFERSTTGFEAYQRGERTLEELNELMNEYHDSFQMDELDKRVQAWVARGQRWLSQIHAGDIDDDVATITLTSGERIDKWKNTLVGDEVEEHKIRLLLRTGAGNVVEGSLLAMFNLSKCMDPGPRGCVAITLPEVTDDFGLEVYLNDGWQPLRHNPEEILTFLSVMATMTGGGERQPVASLLHQLIVSTQFGVDIYKCLEADVINSTIFDTLVASCRSLRICETFISLREEILRGEKETGANRWKFIITLEAFESAIESYEAFVKLQTAARNVNIFDRIDWIVGSFNLSLESTNAPLLFLFKDGELKGVCLDNLEIGLLESNLISVINDPAHKLNLFDGKSERLVRNCFFPSRATFAIQVSRIFNPTLAERNYSVLAAINSRGVCAPIPPSVREAMAISTAVASFAPKAALASALTDIAMAALDNDQASHFQNIVLDLGWSPIQKSFPDVNFQDLFWVTKLCSDMWTFVYITGTSFLRTVGICIRSLEACLKDLATADEETIEFDPVYQIRAVYSDESCDDVSAERIKEIFESGKEKLLKYTEILEIVEDLRTAELAKRPDYYANFNFLLQLLELCRDELAQEPDPEEEDELNRLRKTGARFASQRINFSRRMKYKHETEELIMRLLQHFVVADKGEDGIQWPDPATKEAVAKFIHDGLYSNALAILSKLKFPKWHQLLFAAIQSPLTPFTLLQILQVLETLANKSEPEEPAHDDQVENIYSFCWMNPQFQALMHLGLNETTFIVKAIAVFCKVDDDGGKMTVHFPPYLTKEMIEAIMDYLNSQEGEDPSSGGGEKEWESIDDTLFAFQTAYVHHKHEHAPPNTHKDNAAANLLAFPFYNEFRHNVTRQPALFEILNEIGAPDLLNWDEETKLVTEAVSVRNVNTAVELILKYIQENSHSKQSTFTLSANEIIELRKRLRLIKRDPRTATTESVFDSLVPDAVRGGGNRISALRATKSLLSLQTHRGPISAQQFWQHWNNNEKYQHLILAFSNLIQIDDTSQRNLILHRLETELISWNTNVGGELRRVIHGLHQRLKSAREDVDKGDNAKIRKLVQLILRNYAALESTNVQLPHFFHEFQQLYRLMNDAATATSNNRGLELIVSHFPRAVTDYFQGHGVLGSIQLFEDPCSTRLNPILLQSLVNDSSSSRVLVLTVLGLIGGSSKRDKFLRQIVELLSFGSTSEKLFTVGAEGGVTVHKIPVRSPSHLSGIQAVYLIETPECRGCLPEYNLQNEGVPPMTMTADQILKRKLISFAASVSHLVIVDWNLSSTRSAEEMLDVVGKMLIDCGGMEYTTAVEQDLVFVLPGQDGDEEQLRLSSFVNDIGQLTDAHGFEFGLRSNVTFRGQFEKVLTRAEEGRICIPMRTLVDELSSGVATFDGITPREWRHVLENNWRQIEAMYEHTDILRSTPFPRASSLEAGAGDLQSIHALWDIFALLGVTFLHHATAAEQFLVDQFAGWKESDDPEQFEAGKHELLEFIRKHLTKVPWQCSGLNPADTSSGICTFCSRVLEKWGEFSDSDYKCHIQRVEKQAQYLTDSAWNKCYQMANVLELQLFDGITPAFERIYTKALKIYSTEISLDPNVIVEYVAHQMKFWYTDQVRVPLLPSVVKDEIRVAYCRAPFVLDGICEWFFSSTTSALPPFDWPTNSLSPFQVNFKLKSMVDDAVTSWARLGPGSTSDAAPKLSLYQPGMMQELQLRVQAAVDSFQRMEPEKDFGLDPANVNMEVGLDLQWRIHVYAVKLFVTCMREVEEDWRAEYDLVRAQAEYHQAIVDEVVKRLAADWGQNKNRQK